jgi:hypothetical protein
MWTLSMNVFETYADVFPNRECAAGHDSDDVVEVNQRALIDKILARYSGEFMGQSRYSRIS